MADFDYDAAAELFPTRRRLPGVSRSVTSGLHKRQKPFNSRWRTCRRNVWSARFSKSTSRDTAATISAGCTKAPNTRWPAALRDHDR